jgi:hypothetical protein
VASSSQVAVSTTPVDVTGAHRVKNTSASQVVYVGGSNVTTSNGYPLAAGAEMVAAEAVRGDLFVVAAAAATIATLSE